MLPGQDISDYLLVGGFPKALTSSVPRQLLQEYFMDIIYRGVLTRSGARNPKALMQVARMAFETCGTELSLRKMAAATGTTVDTVKSYLEAFEQAYLLFRCPFFSFSEKAQSSQNKKYYPIDPALRSAVTNTYTTDLGKSLEVCAFLKLKRTYGNVCYFRAEDQGEVNFVVTDGSKIIPYQVSLHGPQPRHEKALERFYAVYPNAEDPVFVSLQNANEFL